MAADAPTPGNPIDTASLIERGLELGLDAVGVCHAEPYDRAIAAIAAGAAAGRFADLRFTMAQPEISCHPEHGVPGAAAVISAALCYWRPDPATSSAGPPTGLIARFSRFDPYAALHARLTTLAELLSAAGHQATVLVDDNAHVDREAAARSGVGFFGKNSNIITRHSGSWVVLGTIITSAPLESTPEMRPGCGDCTACIDACPTGAIVADGVVDARACLTYWTQSRHEFPHDIAAAMGERLYGCDTCQEVCPWNRGVESRRGSDSPVDGAVSLVDWLTTEDSELNRRYRRFFIPRRRMAWLRRNALVALGNTGRPEDAPLAAAYADHAEPAVQAAARYALERLGHPSWPPPEHAYADATKGG